MGWFFWFFKFWGFFGGMGGQLQIFWFLGVFFDEVKMEMDKDKTQMGEAGSWDYLYID